MCRRKHVRYKLTPGSYRASEIKCLALSRRNFLSNTCTATVWLFQGEIFFQIHVLQNLWVSNVLMSSYILCKILSFQARVAQKVFNTSGSYSAELIMLWLFNYQNWFICSSIRKWIVYVNEANIVTVLWQARSSNLFAHQHTLAPITFAKLCAGIPVE